MKIANPDQIKNHWREQRLFNQRIVACATIAVIATAAVLGRLAVLQIIDADYYAAQSQGNRIRVEPLPPTRGLIYDRNRRLLAENTPSYQLELTPEQVPDVEQTLAALVGKGVLPGEDLERIRQLIASKRRFESIPIKQRLDDSEVARFAALRPYFPGVEIRARLARSYPFGKIVAHAIGYVGGISAADQTALDESGEAIAYSGTSYIGKVSLERAYEPDLHGDVGHQDVLVNARGRRMQVLDTRLSVPGHDLILSLDIEAQIAAHAAMGDRRGAVVAIDPDNGDILVFSSTPGFDPNQFISGMSQREFEDLQNDPNQPLFNRAMRGSYPPGSTIKPILALAALEQKAIDPKERIFCRGFYTLPGRSHRYRDWKPLGHGWIDMHDAIAQSCDTYFYSLATELGIDPMTRVLSSFGLGTQTGIDIRPESSGLVPSREWKRRNFAKPGDQVWFPGETVITGIGQGYMLATPLQLAHATAAIAARGTRYQPTLVKGTRDPVTGILTPREPVRLPSIELADPAHWDKIIAAMRGVIADPRGTARALGKDAPWPIAGKSGTAQVFTVAQDQKYDELELAERMKDHALFVAFAPFDDPRIAVAVIVENGSGGSTVAGPVARAVIDAYLGGAT